MSRRRSSQMSCRSCSQSGLYKSSPDALPTRKRPATADPPRPAEFRHLVYSDTAKRPSSFRRHDWPLAACVRHRASLRTSHRPDHRHRHGPDRRHRSRRRHWANGGSGTRTSTPSGIDRSSRTQRAASLTSSPTQHFPITRAASPEDCDPPRESRVLESVRSPAGGRTEDRRQELSALESRSPSPLSALEEGRMVLVGSRGFEVSSACSRRR